MQKKGNKIKMHYLVFFHGFIVGAYCGNWLALSAHSRGVEDTRTGKSWPAILLLDSWANNPRLNGLSLNTPVFQLFWNTKFMNWIISWLYLLLRNQWIWQLTLNVYFQQIKYGTLNITTAVFASGYVSLLCNELEITCKIPWLKEGEKQISAWG